MYILLHVVHIMEELYMNSKCHSVSKMAPLTQEMLYVDFFRQWSNGIHGKSREIKSGGSETSIKKCMFG